MTGAQWKNNGGVVAAGHPVTARAAADVLAAGGTAFDAVIAALWAACAAEPVLASLGGGGFLLAHDASGETKIWDFFAHTPRARQAEEDFYEVTVDFGVATQAFHVGIGSIAAPGFVRGLFDVHRAHGTMPMTRLVEPAIEAAREGVVLSDYQAYLLEVVGPMYDISREVRAIFRCDDPGDESSAECRSPLKSAGDTFYNPALADTLDALAREGDGLFYDGEIAGAIARLCSEGGGHLSRADLTGYRAVARPPLVRRYRDVSLALNPPPSAGGVLIALALELLPAAMSSPFEWGKAAHIDALIRAMTATNCARAACSDDGLSGLALLDEELVNRWQRDIVGAPPSSRGTTHVSVIDGAGNAAGATVSNGEGCGHLAPGAGFMLNNMLGEADLCEGGVGQWAPDRRMSSMMAPTAVEWPDGSYAVLGSGGSNRIRTAILQVLHNLVDHRMTVDKAVNASRVHVEGDHLDAEATLPRSTVDHLRSHYADHTIWPERNMFFGGVHSVVRAADGTLSGAGDPRRAGLSTIV